MFVLLSFLLVSLMCVSSGYNASDKTRNYDERTPHGFQARSPLELFPVESQQSLQRIQNNFLKLSEDKLWKPIENISIGEPFFFFHQRKAGGTDIRVGLHTLGKQLGLPTFVICYDAPCVLIEIPLDHARAIYAGHINWGKQFYIPANARNFDEKLSQDSNDYRLEKSELLKNIKNSETNLRPYHCMTNFRDPLSRIISCIYFVHRRELNLLNVSCISELNDLELVHLVRHQYTVSGNTCINEPFEIMSGITDYELLGNLGSDLVVNQDGNSYDIKPRFNVVDEFVLEITLKHMEKCIPMMIESADNIEFMKHKAPILYNHNVFHESNQQPHTKESDKCGRPTDRQIELLENLVAFETILYQTVNSKFQKVLQSYI